MRIALSDHFTYQKLLRFTMPSIVMMIVTSVYSIVDGFFVSNCVGKNAFAALNLIFPVLMALSAFGFMVGTGGSALIAKTLGEGKTKEANGSIGKEKKENTWSLRLGAFWKEKSPQS